MTSTPPHQSLVYRRDIDGLRAVAVVPVVLFHLGCRGFSGGFVGVDVFFVISGYLITGIIARELQQGRFSMATFYRRRVLRIFPALFAMMAVVAALSCPTMLPLELVRFAKSVAATTLFSSNILYFAEAGYFEPAAHLKPLLHTWSLAVEEQFYVLWPLLLAALSPRLGRRLWLPTSALAALSFAWSLWAVQTAPSAAFYLLPARTWELLGGALLALLPTLAIARPALRETLAVFGLSLILFSVTFYNQATAFPGFSALAPCLGAMLLLATGAHDSTRVAKGLSLRPLVFIGKISFSLYLWHWPVIVLTQIVLFKEPTVLVRVLQLAASVLLAFFSWRFIEQPFRGGTESRMWRPALVGAGATMSVAVLVSAAVLLTHGLPGRFSPSELRLAAYEGYDGDEKYRGGSCFVVGADDAFDAGSCLTPDLGRPNILLLGDSHGAHLWPGLAVLEPAVKVLQATHTGCRPLAYADTQEGACQGFFREVLTQWLPKNPVGTVVLAGRWTGRDLPLLEKTLVELAQNAQRVVVVGPIQQYAAALPKLLIQAGRSKDPTSALADGRLSSPFNTDKQLHALCARVGAQYVSLIGQLCASGVCRTRTQDGDPLQFDYGHLTEAGSREVVRLFASEVVPVRAAELIP